MSGTKEGGLKTAKKVKKKLGKDFHALAGSEGGKASAKSPNHYSPFSDPEFARKMAQKGLKKRWNKNAKPKTKV